MSASKSASKARKPKSNASKDRERLDLTTKNFEQKREEKDSKDEAKLRRWLDETTNARGILRRVLSSNHMVWGLIEDLIADTAERNINLLMNLIIDGCLRHGHPIAIDTMGITKGISDSDWGAYLLVQEVVKLQKSLEKTKDPKWRKTQLAKCRRLIRDYDEHRGIEGFDF